MTDPADQVELASRSRSKPHRNWRLAAGLALSALCLFLAVRKISPEAVKEALSVARWEWAALAALVIVASTTLKAVRWRALFLPQRVPLGKAWSVYMIGQMLNAVLPARAGEVGRIYFIGEQGEVSRAVALSTVVVEKVVDLVLLMAAYVVLALWLITTPAGIPDWLQDAGLGLFVLTALALATLLLLTQFGHRMWDLLRRLLRPLPYRWRAAADRAVEQAIAALSAFHKGPARTQVWTWSLLIWTLMALTNGLLFQAFSLELSPYVALFLLVVLMSGVAAPPLPGNLGVFVYLCVLVLSFFGIERELALVYGVTLQLVAYLPLIALGAGCLIWVNASLRRSPSASGLPSDARLEHQQEESGTVP